MQQLRAQKEQLIQAQLAEQKAILAKLSGMKNVSKEEKADLMQQLTKLSASVKASLASHPAAKKGEAKPPPAAAAGGEAAAPAPAGGGEPTAASDAAAEGAPVGEREAAPEASGGTEDAAGGEQPT